MKNTRAYTMVEIVISIALFTVVMAGIYGALTTSQIIYNKNSAFMEMEAQCRNAVDRIVREVRQASSQTITTNFNSTTNDKIMFTIPSAIGIQYYLSGTNLVRRAPDGTTKTIASNVDRLKFSLTGSLLTINVRASQTVYQQAITYPLIAKVRLRNE
ncbi:MAG: prepilin-type N-terminal cleavage/methylation domain-containing protein [Candidatus Omnitrophica bacterium]|nr:prepilin-type N-terminal cleavage/methylation domain-containing protein [Candidatus Omnitrophota bacterium]